jgi:twitching motility protein PilT
MIRVHGDVRRINVEALEHAQVHDMVYDIMNDAQRKHYDTLECDFSSRSRAWRGPRQRLQPERGAGAVFRNYPEQDSDARAAEHARLADSVPAPGIVLSHRAHNLAAAYKHARGEDGELPERKNEYGTRADVEDLIEFRSREHEVPDQPARSGGRTR